MSPATEQRLTDTRLIPVDLEPASATLDGQRVIVQWPASEVDPAGGSSEFEASFLFQAAYCSAKAAAGDARPVPEDADWGNRSRYDDESSRGAMRALFGQAADPAAEAGVRAPRTPDRPGGTPGDAAAHPSDGAEGMRMPVDRLRAAGGVREAAEAIHRDGWLIIDGVAGTEMGTEEVAVPLFGWPMTTLYGEGFWRTEVRRRVPAARAVAAVPTRRGFARAGGRRRRGSRTELPSSGVPCQRHPAKKPGALSTRHGSAAEPNRAPPPPHPLAAGARRGRE